MIILGLDASSTAVGWTVIAGDRIAQSGAFDLVSDLWWTRIRTLDEWLRYKIEGVITRFGLPIIGYEIASGSHRNTKTDRILGAVEYVCRCAADEIGCEFVQVAPAQVKATGYHKDALIYAEAAIREYWPAFAFDLSTQRLHDLAGDQADSIGVAFAARAILRKAGRYE